MVGDKGAPAFVCATELHPYGLLVVSNCQAKKLDGSQTPGVALGVRINRAPSMRAKRRKAGAVLLAVSLLIHDGAIGGETLTEADLPILVLNSQSYKERFKTTYQGKAIVLSGNVTYWSVSLDKNGLSGYVKMTVPIGNGAMDIRGNVDGKDVMSFSRTVYGQRVSITGMVDDTLLGELMLKHCIVTNQ